MCNLQHNKYVEKCQQQYKCPDNISRNLCTKFRILVLKGIQAIQYQQAFTNRDILDIYVFFCKIRHIKISQYNKVILVNESVTFDKIYNGELIIQNSIQLKNIGFLQNLKIHKLELIGCMHIIPNLKSSTIKELKVANCCLKEINTILLENLEILDASYNSALNMQVIEKFKNLRQLDISNTNLVDISNLKLQQLSSLQLRNNKIKDIPSLSNLINLVELDLSQNADIDIDPLQQMKQLRAQIIQMQSLKYINIGAAY
ncbi:Conserved_hypothetical protein [Hexamita inflata]|uniref:Uncharacterized protein n=1 Tax=Hexamita inflata TaxID=28002 RepID=A0AA86NEK8_9EUKA|nr:Conserved hypothetical protein [Hexamita inflata]